MAKSSLYVLLLLFLYGCETYNWDPFDPRLPEYSSKGADVAGCIFNGGVWRELCSTSFNSNDCGLIIFTYDSLTNSTRFGFSGNLVRDSQGAPVGDRVSISFVFPNRRIGDLEDLLNLQEQVPLSGEVAFPVISYPYQDEDQDECENEFSSEGNLYFHSIYLIPATETSPSEIVIAGTFGFKLESDCWNYDIQRGRFDYDDVIFLDESW